MTEKQKSATTEAVAQKTQTPIVAKPIQYKGHYSTITLRNLHFYQIRNVIMLKKGYTTPIEKQKIKCPYDILNWFGIISLPQCAI